MHRHHGLDASPPAAAFFVQHRKPVRLITLMVIGLSLAACSAGADDADRQADGSESTDDTLGEDLAHTDDPDRETAGDGWSDGGLTFRDPQADGFAPVVDNDAAPVGPGRETATVKKPDLVIAGIADQLIDRTSTEEILESVDVLDDATDVATDRDGRPRNGSGEPVTLDDEASLACAHAEIAVGQLDVGQVSVALERIATAAHHAGRSGLAVVRDWAEPLSTVVVDGVVADLAPLVGFLSVCTEGGYEL